MIETDITIAFLATVAAYFVSVVFAGLTTYVYWQQSWKLLLSKAARLEWPNQRAPDYVVIAAGVCTVAATEMFARTWWTVMLIAGLIGLSSKSLIAVHMAEFMLSQIWVMLPALLLRIIGYGMHVSVHVRAHWWDGIKLRHVVGASMGLRS